MSSEFEKLAAELELLAKAQPATQEDKVLAAAKEAGVDTDQVGEKPEDEDDEEPLDDLEDEGDEVLGKSYSATDAAGQTVKAYDATELIKSMYERIAGVESTLQADNANLSKSLNAMVDMFKSQDDQIESLKKTIVNLSKQGAGRRAMLTVNEKPEASMVKSAPAMNTETFMMKANAAFNSGRISGKDLTVCDVSLRHGEAIDAGLLNRIFES